MLTWVYISVVLLLLWPNNSWMYLKSVPFSSKCVANECLKVCIDPSVVTPAFVFALCKIVKFIMHERYEKNQYYRIMRFSSASYVYIFSVHIQQYSADIYLKGSKVKAVKWLRWVCNSFPNLFYHWTLGYQLT